MADATPAPALAWLKSSSCSSADDFPSDLGGRALDEPPPAAGFSALLSAQAAVHTAPATASAAAAAAAAAAPSAAHTARRREFRFYNLEPDGALRPGGARPLWTRRSAGLLATYAAVGLLYGALPAAVGPLLRSYLLLPAFQAQAARRLLDTPWLWKVVAGALSDALPVRGRRRQPYMVLGWLAAAAALAAVGLMDQPPPAAAASSSASASAEGSAEDRAAGWRYAAGMGAATVGALVANVAADGLMVEWAQREPLAARGRTQTLTFALRCLGMFAADFAVDALLNGADYGGDASFSVGAGALLLSLAGVALLAAAAALWLLDEDPWPPCDEDSAGAASATTVASAAAFRALDPGTAGMDADAVLLESPAAGRAKRPAVTGRQLWRLAQARAVWTLVLFMFSATLLGSVAPAAASGFVARWYVRVSPDARSASDLVRGGVYALSLLATQRLGQAASWPAVFAAATAWVVAVRVLTAAVTVFNIARSQWLLLYAPGLLATPAAAARQLVMLLPIAETAPRGLEATTYGLVITFYNLALMNADAASKFLGGLFRLQDVPDADADSLRTRWTVMWAFLAAFAAQLASVGAAMFLARQRLEVQQLRYYGGYSAAAAAVVCAATALAIVYSVVTVVLASIEETSCLRIAGGQGC